MVYYYDYYHYHNYHHDYYCYYNWRSAAEAVAFKSNRLSGSDFIEFRYPCVQSTQNHTRNTKISIPRQKQKTKPVNKIIFWYENRSKIHILG